MATTSNSKRLITADEAAEMLNISPAALERMRARGEGPSVVRPTGRRLLRYIDQDVTDWIERQRSSPSLRENRTSQP